MKYKTDRIIDEMDTTERVYGRDVVDGSDRIDS